MKYKVKYFNHISDSVYTLERAKELVEYLNETFKGCKAHMIEIKEKIKMKEKIKKLKEFCEFYNLDLHIRYYGDRQVCFSGIYENDDEIFMVSINYNHKNERIFYINLNSELEKYRNNGSFSKEEILLLLSLDDLTDDELLIKPLNG